MKGINNLAKKYFLAQMQIVRNFHNFLRSAPVEFPSKIQFFKNCLKFGETLLLVKGINNLAKKYFLAQIQIVPNFHYFCKVPACRICVKNSIYIKLPKIVEKHFC